MSWLITGGCGFIGTNLIEFLLKKTPPRNIRVLDNLTGGKKEDLGEVCNFVELDPKIPMTDSSTYAPSVVQLVIGNILDFETCLNACKGVEVIVHLAANTGVAPSVENPRTDMETNIIGTFNLLEAARKNRIQQFIFASSGAPLGEVSPPIHEEKAPKPVSPYGASKLAGEAYCSAYARTFGVNTVSLRFGNVYGPRSKHKTSVVAKFFTQALKGEPLEIFGDGHQTRDFIYIDDLIQAIMLSAQKNDGGEVFQIATHKETTINEIAMAIKEIVEKETGKEVSLRHASSRTGDVMRNYSDISKAKKKLGYQPKFHLHDGLKQTFKYFNILIEGAS